MKTVRAKQPQNLLNKRLNALQECLSVSLNWVERYRQHTPRLALEAETLTVQLHRARFQAATLAQQLARPATLALYGQSQAGKAWLLKEMVADAQGQLIMQAGEKSLDWFSHINPGNLDFAAATRFTHQRDPLSTQWPVELVLLSEAEVLRLLLACAHSDVAPDVRQIEATLKKLQRHKLPEAPGGLESDALVALWSWCRRNRAHRDLLDRHYWPQAIELAPWLSVDDRAELFALLWPAQPELTALWRTLIHQRHQLRHCQRLLAPLSLLVDDAQLPAERLIASGLENDAAESIEVCPLTGNRIGKPQMVALSTLVLLTRELVVPLSSTPRLALYDDADMLELPAPGTPMDENVAEDRRLLAARDPLRARLLEAKRTLLPGWYAERQGIDLLMVCTAASQRHDSELASQTLREWQLHRPVLQPHEKPRLIWAITAWDARHQQHNVDEAVQRQIGQPGQNWGSMLALDRAGVDRMGEWLSGEMQLEGQQEKRGAQLAQLQSTVIERLRPWTEAEASTQQAEKKQAIADTLLKCLQHRTGLHGELLERLQPAREALRQLWLMPQESPERFSASAPTAQSHFGIGFEFDLFSDAPFAEEQMATEQTQNVEQRFAQQVLTLWISHLRQLPESPSLLMLLNVDKATLELLVEELITASFRLRIADKLQQALHEPEAQTTAHEARADRQVSRAMTVLGDFVAWLGFLQRPETERPASRVNRGQPIFARPPAPSVSFSAGQRLTRLSAVPANHTAFYIYDWLVGLNTLIVENNGFTGGGELPAEARAELKALLVPLSF
ncbi:virulence factor SrfC family protein [[Erwinia] mediterraneensis]|uniref:virulence factor SrfC family protein n=1 Tax=[Erwinia] mediterraneensis TaxID=2161819 RepID=UPI0010325931|nr:virulence factor SrfC family protein [[Erwinia] mediterraneensis]